MIVLSKKSWLYGSEASVLNTDVMLSMMKYTPLQINLLFTTDPTESLVYDVLQLNVLHTGRLMFQLARYSRYRRSPKPCEENFVDLEYADDIVPTFEEEGKAQVFLDEPTKVILSCGMHLEIGKGEALEVVERFTYLGSCISSDCSVTDEVNARICKARAAFANLRHLWRQNGLSLNLKGRVYQATVRAVLLYGCETWPIRAADLRRLQVFDNRCLRTIARVGWCQRIRNEAVRKRVFGCVTGTSIEECVQHQKLRWLGHVLRMPNHRLPKRVLFSMPNSEWRKQRGGQPMTWQRSMKEITKRLGAVGATRLPGWGSRDPHCAWLETLHYMVANRCQWRSCCQFLSRSPE
ncbi:hypothetical protein T265_05867 [Opisthorchis viverrini]|uniref:Reverse transcriptase domain-containing protein n=1 Tax=Opisthorchis viverrini TaxID=6198 RepID=A0A074ZI24_OPIVI|nr:hypothetical protein T265_05867 [Opisthorchis viverrini]KER26958.1 hypothetical protein T265_05867 [Opisthorchis viverrini]